MVVVPNGIIRKFCRNLKDNCLRRVIFNSQTDTEVIVRLVEKFLRKIRITLEAVKHTIEKLHGIVCFVTSFSRNKGSYCSNQGSPLTTWHFSDEKLVGQMRYLYQYFQEGNTIWKRVILLHNFRTK